MRRSTRVFIFLGVLEVLLLAGGAYMVMQVTSGSWNAPDPSEAITRIFTVIGAAMPLVAIVLVLIAMGLRRKGD